MPDEPSRQAAIELEPLLKLRTTALAPRLQMWEIGQAIHARHRPRVGGTLTDREELVARLLRYTRFDDPSPPALQAAGRLAETQGISVYDAAYLELAIRLTAVLVTQDQKLLRIAKKVLGNSRAFDVPSLLRRLTGAA